MIEAGWGQGRATYGGLVAGLLAARAEQLIDDPARRLRVANITFVGPVEPGDASIDVEVLRSGSSATSVHGRVVQSGDVRTTFTATYGADRATQVSVDGSRATAAPAIARPEAVEAAPFIEGLLPDFLQHVELRFAAGSPPFTGAREAAFGGWMRFREAPARMGDRELLALTDAWPPGVAPLFTGPAPMSSLGWTYEVVGTPPADEPDAPDAHWQYDVRTLVAAHGYGSTTARIWDAAGRLRALSRQTIAYFEPR
ncbi:MAG: thioesterase family protein [Solirubrobacteraceae bacterium]|nr:thioesterase family protein [Solirubrobacteraceae bacterium]